MSSIMLNLFNFKTTPYEHQKTALEKSWTKENYAFFMEMGTGKTKVAIDNIGLLRIHEGITGVLIIAPKSVYTVWAYDEIKKHMSPDIDYSIYIWNVDKPKRLKEAYKVNKDLTIFCMNVEALSTTRGYKGAIEFLTKHKGMTIIDESTTIKNHKAIRTKNVLKLSGYSHYKRILTGSPITKSPLDLYTQCGFLSESLLGYSSYYTFRNRYCVTHRLDLGGGKYTEIPKYYVHLEELEEKLKTFSYRVTKDECLDLPPKQYAKRYVEMNEDQERVYRSLKQSAIAVIEDETVSYNNKLTEIIKLHQVGNGFVKTNDSELKEFKNPKLHALSDLIEESNGKMIIWANYIYNIENIIKFLQDKYGRISVVANYGAIDSKKRTIAMKRFQEDPECRFFVGNPTTGGFGLTLTAATNVVYFSNNFNYEVRRQSEDRAHRSGQTKTVLYTDIICKNTLDERILSSLSTKDKLATTTMGDEFKEWLK
jgi:SNF2 family DNA or RNA helicase|tara:strand:- start:1643 stop:3085 length:1443 start_codon:yes stop_codon:yes gene_type:complete